MNECLLSAQNKLMNSTGAFCKAHIAEKKWEVHLFALWQSVRFDMNIFQVKTN